MLSLLFLTKFYVYETFVKHLQTGWIVHEDIAHWMDLDSVSVDICCWRQHIVCLLCNSDARIETEEIAFCKISAYCISSRPRTLTVESSQPIGVFARSRHAHIIVGSPEHFVVNP